MRLIDLFAGVGGFTQGAVTAGHEVVWAANHNPQAVKWHGINHPETEHSCQDLQQADFREVPAHRGMLCSPACQGHSLGRGKEKPHHDAQRATAWAVVTCAECHEQELIVLENVPQFLKWKLYPAFKHAMRSMDYTISEHLLDAADFGVPQHRPRLFLLMTKGREHPDLSGCSRQDHIPARSFIDLEAGKWSKIYRPGRSAKTTARIERGRAQHGDVFLAPYYSKGSGLGGRSIDRPIGTLTTRSRWAVIRGDEMRMLTVAEQMAAMGFPSDYKLPSSATQATMFLGNAVAPPVVTAILKAAA